MFTTLLLLLVPSASAIIYGGNPELTLQVTRPTGDLDDGGVLLHKVRLVACGGGWTDFVIDETIDPVVGYTLDVSAGDWCTARFYWDNDLILNGTNSNGSYRMRYEQDVTVVTLGSPIVPVALTPYVTVFGIIYGGNPELHVVID